MMWCLFKLRDILALYLSQFTQKYDYAVGAYTFVKMSHAQAHTHTHVFIRLVMSS